MHMISPVPNLNGSHASVLAEQMADVSRSLDAALSLMCQWQPHGRDYQIGGDYMADRKEFERRAAVVSELVKQYMDEAIRVMEFDRPSRKEVRA